MQDSPKLAAAAAQAHGREELYSGMGVSRPATDIAPVAARPIFPLSPVTLGVGPRNFPMCDARCVTRDDFQGDMFWLSHGAGEGNRTLVISLEGS